MRKLNVELVKDKVAIDSQGNNRYQLGSALPSLYTSPTLARKMSATVFVESI